MFQIQPEGVVTFFLLFLLIKLFFLKEKFGYWNRWDMLLLQRKTDDTCLNKG